MASHLIASAPWTPGTSVSVYAADAIVAGQDTPTGTAVTSAAVSAGQSVTFTGLTQGIRYLAYANGVARRFLIPHDDETVAGVRARVDDLEKRLPVVEGSSDPSSDPPGAVLRTAAPFITGRMRLRDRWAAGDFGAKFGGNDETTQLQSAVHETRIAGRTLYLPDGVSAATSTLSDPADAAFELNVVGAGKGMTTLLHGIAGGAMFDLLGTINAARTIDAPVALGASTLTISSTSGIVPGDIVILRDTSQPIYGGSTRAVAAVYGEMDRVKSVDSSTTLTLRGRLANPYTTAGDLRVLSASPGMRVKGLTMRNPTPGTLTVLARGIVATFAKNVGVSDVEFIDFDGVQVYLHTVRGWEVGSCSFQDARDLEQPTNPYNVIATNGTQHGSMHDCEGRYGRHLFTTGASVTEPPAAWNRVSDCIGTEYTEATYDTHPGTRRHTFSNVEAHHCAGFGIQIRGPDTRVVNPTISGATTGIVFIYGAHRGRLIGGTAEVCSDALVLVQSSDDCFIGGAFRGDATGGVDGVRVTRDTAWSADMTKFAIDPSVEIAGNPSNAALNFAYWNNNFRMGRLSIPDATTKIAGFAGYVVASAATVTLGDQSDVWAISGTTSITSITAGTRDRDRVVMLQFQGASAIIDGSNLKLNGSLAPAKSGDTITLMCDGALWYELARSVN